MTLEYNPWLSVHGKRYKKRMMLRWLFDAWPYLTAVPTLTNEPPSFFYEDKPSYFIILFNYTHRHVEKNQLYRRLHIIYCTCHHEHFWKQLLQLGFLERRRPRMHRCREYRIYFHGDFLREGPLGMHEY